MAHTLDKLKKANTVHTNKTTNKMHKERKLNAFAQIFGLLDSDRDGQISSMAIDISRVNTELLEVLSPLLIELEEINESLNLEDFQAAMCRLYESLPLPQRDILCLKRENRSKRHQPEYSFKVSQSPLTWNFSLRSTRIQRRWRLRCTEAKTLSNGFPDPNACQTTHCSRTKTSATCT